MVCLGNICRSPMADGLLQKKVKTLPFEVIVDSAGTASHHVGEAPDSRMRATAAKYGFPIDHLKARQFIQTDFDLFDFIYVMDKNNYDSVVRLARNKADVDKVDYILNMTNPKSNTEVPDPYYGGEQGFINVFDMLNEATDKIVEKIKKI